MENGGGSDLSKVAEKIQKLLNLANHAGTNENEAALAMEKVQEILATYNMTMAQVEGAVSQKNGNGKNGGDAPRTKETLTKSAMYEYQQQLMKAIANTHYCIHFIGKKSHFNEKTLRWQAKKFHVLVGREANVMASKMVFEYLNGTIDRLVNGLYPPPTNLSKSAVSWREGCAYRLRERLYDKMREADRKQEEKVKSDPTSSTALVKLTDVRRSETDLNYDFHYGMTPGSTALARAKRESEIANLPTPPPPPKPTAEEEARAQRAQEKRQRQYRKAQDRYWANKDISAFNQGYKKGNDVGLGDQINSQASRKAEIQ